MTNTPRVLVYSVCAGVYEDDFHSARSRLARAMLVTIRNMIGKGKSINVLNKNGVSPVRVHTCITFLSVKKQT